jgi:hypothetical protein
MRSFTMAFMAAAILLVASAGAALAQTESESPTASMAAETPPPQATDLIAMFPAEVGGQPILEDLQVRVGEEHIDGLDPEDADDAAEIAAVEAVVQAVDAPLSELTSAATYVAVDEANYALLGAFRIPGIDATQIVEPMLAWAELSLEQPRVEPASYADRDVTLLYDDARPDDPPWYFYPFGDTLWVMVAAEPLLTEIFGQLP